MWVHLLQLMLFQYKYHRLALLTKSQRSSSM
jgi:hypothetical protein